MLPLRETAEKKPVFQEGSISAINRILLVIGIFPSTHISVYNLLQVIKKDMIILRCFVEDVLIK